LHFFSAGAPEVGNRKFKKSLLARRHEAPSKEPEDTSGPKLVAWHRHLVALLRHFAGRLFSGARAKIGRY
jgi:hypothetical protein